jgi:hypothetical protein
MTASTGAAAATAFGRGKQLTSALAARSSDDFRRQ